MRHATDGTQVRFKIYNGIWLMCLAFLCFEYFALNNHPENSWLRKIGFAATSKPGNQLSLFLGWSGLSLMIAMNVYTARKKFSFLEGKGSLIAWLEFHIFCGLLGPTFILFHCNFKARGLVAISFWSMLIAASSGVIGRYLYNQVVGLRRNIQDDVDKWQGKLKKMQAAADPALSDESLDKLKVTALAYAGVKAHHISADGEFKVNPFTIFFSSLAGDIRMLMDPPRTAKGLPPNSRHVLKYFALARRRVLFLQPFRDLVAYWHTFHLPFAIFMYAAAFIHVIAALILGVGK